MIPDKIKIAGYEITIKIINKLIEKREHLGEYSPMEQEISIDINNTKQQRFETFIHEIFEAIMSVYGIKLEHDKLNLLAVALHQVIMDNPGIFNFNKEVI